MTHAAADGKHVYNLDPWPAGTRCLIRNETISGRRFMEGPATIKKVVDDDRNIYAVEFDDEPGTTYERVVFGGDVLAKG